MAFHPEASFGRDKFLFNRKLTVNSQKSKVNSKSMLDIQYIRENPKKVQKGADQKQVKVDVNKLLEVDEKRRELIQKAEKIRAKKNKASKKIAKADKEEKKKIISDMKKLDEENEGLEEKLKETEEKFDSLMRQIPNPPLEDVPVGESDEDNKVIEKVGEPPKFDFEPKDHLELGELHNIIDTKRASKTSGSRFTFLKGEAVQLQFALVNFAFENLVKRGFTPVIPPIMLRPEMMEAMGYTERGEDEIFYLEKDDLFLAGTSEQMIGPMHAEEIFEESDFPKKYLGYSSCFRREAGSYGKDTRGILRVHQFDKLEMFIFTTPDKSKEEHEKLLEIEKEMMKKLEIPYQVIDICTGDLGDPAAKKYDIEAWMPGQDRYRETHSTSNCTDFQARRLNVRYRDKDDQLQFAHTLNGTLFAIGRILIAILENNQNEDGSIDIPEALHKYLPFKKIEVDEN
jgi:seryl-tRNA synthetase